MHTKYLAFVFFLFFSHSSLSAQTTCYYIKTALTNKYLDVQWGKSDNGTPLHLWPYNGGAAQKFCFERSGDGPWQYIKVGVGENKYLHVENHSTEPKARAVIWSGKGGDNTKWRILELSDGFYNIISKKGTYLDVQWGKTEDGTPIWMWQQNGDNAQKWKLTPVANRTARAVRDTRIKVTVKSILALNGDDGGDMNFEYYTKIRIGKGWRRFSNAIRPHQYPKYSSSIFSAQPTGTNNDIYPYTVNKTLDRNTNEIQVYIALYDYDDASSDEWVDINPVGGTTDLPLYIDVRKDEIFYQKDGRNVVVGSNGSTFKVRGNNYTYGITDRHVAEIELKIEW